MIDELEENMKKELLLILDFGAHNNQQVAKMARAANVYCEVKPFDTQIDLLKAMEPKGIILIGEDECADSRGASVAKDISEMGVPVLALGNQKSEEEVKAFLFDVCGFSGNWTTEAFIEDMV